MSSSSPTSKVFIDTGKLIQVAIIIGATVTLAVTDRISSDAVMIILGTAAGWIFGNGKSVRDGHSGPAPLFYRNDEEPGDEAP